MAVNSSFAVDVSIVVAVEVVLGEEIVEFCQEYCCCSHCCCCWLCFCYCCYCWQRYYAVAATKVYKLYLEEESPSAVTGWVDSLTEHIWKSRQIYSLSAVRRRKTNLRLVHQWDCPNLVNQADPIDGPTVQHRMDSNSDDVLSLVVSETFSTILLDDRYRCSHYSERTFSCCRQCRSLIYLSPVAYSLGSVRQTKNLMSKKTEI